MKLYYDSEKANKLQNMIYDEWDSTKNEVDPTHRVEYHNEKRGKECHISDVIYCPMKRFCRTINCEEKITRQSVGMMLFGIVAQKILQWMFPEEQCEYNSVISNIVEGHIDVFEELEYPLEIKASRKKIYGKEQLPKEWMRQLISYLAMEGKHKGWIIILNVVNMELSAWCIELTNDEIFNQLIDITNTVNIQEKAIIEKNYGLLSIHPSEFTYCSYRYSCPRRMECKQRVEKKEQLKKIKPLD